MAVELDGLDQSGNGDLAASHLGINENGQTNHNAVAPVLALPGGATLSDGRSHLLRVSWDPASKLMSVSLDGIPRLSYTRDLVNAVFGGQSCVVWGFCGASGSPANRLMVRRRACLSPSPTPTIAPGAGP